MRTYLLTPVRFDAPEWDYSLSREAVQVRAETESRARELATLRFVIGAAAGKSPWSDERLVQARQVDSPQPGMPVLDEHAMALRGRR
jgi:hypothetical protein